MYLTLPRTTELPASPERPGPFLLPKTALYFPVSVVYLPSPKWRTLHALSALVYAGLFLVGLNGNPLCTFAGIVGFIVHSRRAALHGQQIELTTTGLICRTRFSEQRLAYRQIGGMRFALLSGDLLLERPWVRVRIPRRFARRDEIRRAVSLAIWAHRGGDVPPDLAEPGSAFR